MEAIKPTITAIVLVKNEETLLPLCLTSLSWVDEIIVVDNGSTDRSVDVAKKYKARIIHDDSTDFAHLREVGQKKATGSWLLYIDADEEVTPKLRDEITSTVKSFDAARDPVAYTIKRTNFYLGHPWPHSDGMMRLFVASALSGWQGSLHETAMVRGRVGELREHLIHRTHRTLEEMVAKTNMWSEEEADLRFAAHHPPIVAWRLLRVMITAFWQSFITHGGWRAGTVGWIESIYQAFSMFITYGKLWERQQNNKTTIQQYNEVTMMKLLFKFWPIFIIFALWGIFSSPYFFKGLVPFPSTYQVTFFPPWNASHGMPVKNNAMPDVITQIYPWKKLTIDAWKQGEIPLWNPYSFSGTAHAANYQSAVFSPFNLLFFVLPMIDAWSVLILLQPILAGLGMFFFLRTLSRSHAASLVGSMAFMFCGFLVVWMAYGTLGYAALCLPFILAYIYRSLKRPIIGNLLPIPFGIATSFFSGHFQISLYVTAASLFFFLYMAWREKAWKQARAVAVFFVLGLLIILPQIVLTYRAFSASTRGESITRGEIIPWQYLPTLFAPDFYGNPVTRNDWFGHYAEWATFIGVVPLLFAIYALSRKKKDHVTWFFALLAVTSLLLAYPTPVNALLYVLRVPVLSTSAASRIVILFSFSLATLAAFGLDALMSAWKKKELRDTARFALVVAGIVVVGLTVVFVAPLFPADKLAIARRNMILPSAFSIMGLVIFVIGTIALTKPAFARLKRWMPVVLLVALIAMTGADMVRYATKWMPFDPREYVFPEQKTLTFLQKTIGHHRVYGGLGGEVGVYYGIPLIEGYDAMYQGRYGELVTSAATGHFTPSGRSVVMLDKYGVYSERLLQLLGVRYLVHRLSDAQNVWAYPWWQFPQYKSIYRDEHYEVFENEKALPRALLASSYVVARDNQEILDRLFADDFDGRNSVVLEVEPASKPASGSGEVVITGYTSNTVTLDVRTDAPKLLVLSDVYDPGWKARVNGVHTPIYRANYDFRAIAVPAGESIVRFEYRPFWKQ